MKELFGVDLKKYKRQDISSISAAVHYEILLYKMYVIWNFAFMLSGGLFVFINTTWLTTHEMLLYLGIFWGISGLPFFIMQDKVKHKFSASLPGEDAAPPPLVATFLKMLAGFALGAWATHVMLIAALVKIFELINYSRHLETA